MHLNSILLYLLISQIEGHSIGADLVGTWTSKSGKVLTGPDFYNPIEEIILEPNLTGISYSFTSNGFYEEALFRAISNPTTPSCPSAVIQWQHGRFTILDNSTLILAPTAIDGRQILSQPCVSSTTTLTRYNQSERFSKYEVLTDTYNGRLRLNLWQWDGTPVNPMWLAFRPPRMLPTQTLNPTMKVVEPTASAGEQNFNARNAITAEEYREKRDVRQYPEKHSTGRRRTLDANDLFWLGIGCTIIGGLLVFTF